jgi:hypothetical protein
LLCAITENHLETHFSLGSKNINRGGEHPETPLGFRPELDFTHLLLLFRASANCRTDAVISEPPPPSTRLSALPLDRARTRCNNRSAMARL